MSHNKTLTELKWFKWALWGPIGVAVIIAAVITGFDNYSQPLDWGLSSGHINEAISRLKFPIAIASLAFPLVALVASHHRSVQTAAQIARTDNQIVRTDKQVKATEEKNAFENYIKHMEHFRDSVKHLGGLHGIKVGDPSSLYRKIFPLNDYSSFNVWSDDMSFIECSDKDGETEIYHRNYLMFLSRKVFDITQRDKSNGDFLDDVFVDFHNILIYLGVSEFKGVSTDSYQEIDDYFRIDGNVYVPVFSRALIDLADFFSSLQSICCSKTHLNELDVITDSYRRGGMYFFAWHLKKFDVDASGYSIENQKKWNEQTAHLRERNLS